MRPFAILERARRLILPGRGYQSDDPHERGAERDRRARLAALASLGARATSILTLVFLIPAAHQALGPERFGLWMLLSSLTMILAFADLGLGNGILNEIAAARGRDDVGRMRDVIASGFVMLVAIALVLLCGMTLGYRHIDWAALFAVHSPQAAQEARHSVLWFTACFALTLPTTLPSKVQAGLQEGFIANGLMALGNVCAFIGVMVALHAGAGVPVMIGALFGIPAMIQAVAILWYFGKLHPELRPKLPSIDGAIMQRLASPGIAFFVMQVFTIATSRLDAFFVARYAGVAQAGVYSSCDRLFALASVLPLSFLFPLWPAYREALHRGDVAWVKRTLIRSMLQATGLIGAICLPLLLWPDHIFSAWFHSELNVPWWLLAGFAVWKVVEGLGTAGAMLMNGAGWLRSATLMLGGMAVFSITAKLLILPWAGYTAVVWITAASYALFCIAPLAFFVPRILRHFRAVPMNAKGVGA